jgi:hypothetical protein
MNFNSFLKVLLLLSLLYTGNAFAVCEQSSRVTNTKEEFFLVCNSSFKGINYTLTQYFGTSDFQGVLRFGKGNKGFFCINSIGDSVCHVSLGGAIPKINTKITRNYNLIIDDISKFTAIKNKTTIHPKSNIIDGNTPCYLGTSDLEKEIYLGVNKDDLFSLSECIVRLEEYL